jgi:hypothetical protein
MKSKVLLLAAGLAAAGLVAAVALFSGGSKPAESTPQRTASEPAAASAPADALAPAATTLETPGPAALEAQGTTAAAEVRSEVTAPTIRGRVVEADLRTPLAGFEIQLLSRRDTLSRAESDEQGRFELPFPQAERLALVITQPEGWRATKQRQRLSSEAPPAEEIVFELKRSARSFFRGRAIAESNGDPQPYLRLEVGPLNEPLETDADGLFTTRQQFEAEEVVIALVTASGARWLNSQRTVAHDGSSTVHDVALPVGPTYDLNFTTPPGHTLTDLRAFLADVGEECPWTLTDEPSKGEALHAASLPWVRFVQPMSYPEEGELTTLWLGTTDGRWLGSCEVPLGRSRDRGPCDISLAPCGSVELALRAQGRNVSDVVVQLRSPNGDRCAGPRRGPEEDGRHRFHLVPPGGYVLSVDGNRTRAIEHTIRVAAGEPTVVELELESLPPGGAITGFVRTQSGQDKSVDVVGLSGSGGHSQRFTAEVQWSKEGGALVGRFAFEDVPSGEYVLSPLGSSHFEWRSSPEKIAPPAADVELLCLDGAGGMRLEVEAFDARTGKLLDEFGVSLGNRGSGHHSFSFSVNGTNRLELGRFPRDATPEWEATSDGYVAVAGDFSSFEAAGTEDGEPLLRARVELQPGWGGRVLAYTKTERIEGAIVLCDDVEVGRTNERGEVDIVLPARPKRFEVRKPGFVMEFPALGEVPEDAAVLLVYMKPRE